MQVSSFLSDRTFFVAGYRCSHGLLLLMTKPELQKTRIEILFQDVRALEMRMWFTSLEIEVADPSILAGFSSCPMPLREQENVVYSLKSEGWRGYVLGGVLSVHEEELPAGAPSVLAPPSSMVGRNPLFGEEKGWFV